MTDAPTDKKYPGIRIINAGADVEWSDVMDTIIGLYRNMADVSASVQ